MVKQEMYVTKAGEKRYQVAAPVAEDVYRALRQLANEQETTIAAQVRKATEEYVAHSKRPSSRI